MTTSLRDALGAPLSRRRVLAGAAAGLGAGAAAACAPSPRPAPTGLFRHGVASGDPLADRVILWTRVTPSQPGSLSVGCQIATDPEFTNIVKRSADLTSQARDFTVKVDMTGLQPGATYWYRFESRDEVSPVGRTRTLPVGSVEAMKLAAVSCSNYPAGHFHVYREIAKLDDLDLVLHLGDYLYEYGAGGYATEWGANNERVPDPVHEIVSLDDYRRRHAQYRTDLDLQAAHAAAPWITIWDDHESTNNAYRDGAENHDPATEGLWDDRKLAAIRAYFEWMPIREPEPTRLREGIWRSFDLGNLASLTMLETRLTARSPEITLAAAPITADADPADPANQALMAAFLADVVGAPDRTLLGAEQLAFVTDALTRSVEDAKPWQILGNQVVMTRVRSPNYVETLPSWLKWVVRQQFPVAWEPILFSQFNIPLSLDQWDGYPADRERLLAAALAARARLVVLTGDTHTFNVGKLTDDSGRLAGHEFGVSSVTSPSEYNAVPAPGVNFGRLTEAANPDTVILHEVYDRGFMVLNVRASALEVIMRTVSSVERRGYSASDAFRYALTPKDAGGAELTGGKV